MHAPPNDPARVGLSDEERWFLSHVAPYDWRTPRDALAQRLGVSRYHDWVDVIALPPSFLGLGFLAYAEPADLPPENLFADVLPRDDARVNYRGALDVLTHVLGPGVEAGASNCLGRTWGFGVFTVTLRAFPPDLQPPGMRNALLARAPALAARATVTLTSAYAWVYPDPSLAGVGAAAVPVTGRPIWTRADTRRNPPTLVVDGLVAWRDGARVGFSEARDSLLLDGVGPLVHVRVPAGRGPAEEHLELAGKAVLTAALAGAEAHGAPPEPFAATARRVAEAWALPLTTRTDPPAD